MEPARTMASASSQTWDFKRQALACCSFISFSQEAPVKDSSVWSCAMVSQTFAFCRISSDIFVGSVGMVKLRFGISGSFCRTAKIWAGCGIPTRMNSPLPRLLEWSATRMVFRPWVRIFCDETMTVRPPAMSPLTQWSRWFWPGGQGYELRPPSFAIHAPDARG